MKVEPTGKIGRALNDEVAAGDSRTSDGEPTGREIASEQTEGLRAQTEESLAGETLMNIRACGARNVLVGAGNHVSELQDKR